MLLLQDTHVLLTGLVQKTGVMTVVPYPDGRSDKLPEHMLISDQHHNAGVHTVANSVSAFDLMEKIIQDASFLRDCTMLVPM